MSTARQLTLHLKLDAGLSFDNFFVTEENRLLISELKKQALGTGEQWLYFHGGAGRSHLLQASCNLADSQGRRSHYFPLQDLADYPAADVLAGTDGADLLCLDGVSRIQGKLDWELAIFNLYNASLISGQSILIADSSPVDNQQIALADLRSRLQAFSCFQLCSMSEQQCRSALQFCARQRGLVISEQVSDYLFNRCERDFVKLLAILDKLDSLSLQKQRKITTFLAREVLEQVERDD